MTSGKQSLPQQLVNTNNNSVVAYNKFLHYRPFFYRNRGLNIIQITTSFTNFAPIQLYALHVWEERGCTKYPILVHLYLYEVFTEVRCNIQRLHLPIDIHDHMNNTMLNMTPSTTNEATIYKCKWWNRHFYLIYTCLHAGSMLFRSPLQHCYAFTKTHGKCQK